MNVFNAKNIQKALKKIFKEKSTLLEERKEFVDLMINIHTDFFKEIKLNRSRLMKVHSKNQEGQKSILLKVVRNDEEHETKKNYFMKNECKELLKEYNKKYASPVEVEGIKSEIKLEFEPTIYKEASYEESLKYEKNYDYGDFIMVFFYDDNNKLEFLDISVYNNSGRFLNAVIDLKVENKDIFLSFFHIPTRNIKLDINFGSEVEKVFLKSLKEEDLFNLDSKEKEEYYLMLLDFKIDLKDEPLYELFKKGISDFSMLIQKELSPKNNSNTKRVRI